MQPALHLTLDAKIDAITIAGQMLVAGFPAVRPVLAMLGGDPALIEDERVPDILVQALVAMIDRLGEEDVEGVAETLMGIAPPLAAYARDILLAGQFPDDVVDLDRLDDPSALCLALLVDAAGDGEQATDFLEAQRARRGPAFGTACAQLKTLRPSSQKRPKS